MLITLFSLCICLFGLSLYMCPLLSSYGVLSHMYAYFIQEYLHCPSIAAIGARIIHQAMGALEGWMSSSRLCLIAQKNKFI